VVPPAPASHPVPPYVRPALILGEAWTVLEAGTGNLWPLKVLVNGRCFGPRWTFLLLFSFGGRIRLEFRGRIGLGLEMLWLSCFIVSNIVTVSYCSMRSVWDSL